MSYELLKNLINTPSPSGVENGLTEIFTALRYRHFRMYRSPNHSVCFVMNRGSSRTVILDAHIDQVHARIRNIRDDGLIIARPVGFNAESYSGQRVIVHGERREIEGVIQTQPPHLAKVTSKDNVKRNKFMYIDTGLSKSELERDVINGDVITFDAVYKEIGTHYVTGPGLDNKASAFVLINMMRQLDSRPPACNVVMNFSSREEVGGATIQHITANEELKGILNGDVSLIVLDTHLGVKSTSVDESDLELGLDLGKGPSIEHDASTSEEILRELQRVARRERIPLQIEYTDFGGTNKSTYDRLINVRSIDVGIPLRNMHSAVETVDKRDLKWTERLLLGYIRHNCQ
jgi:putative aminopeptidase FrvX